jgi:hypothetical protein
MTQFQRGQAIEMLLVQTAALEAEIEQHDDIALEAWLYELGYEWDSEAQAWLATDDDDELMEF